MTTKTSEDELEIVIKHPGLPARPIGPGDDIVISSQKLDKWLAQNYRPITAIKEALKPNGTIWATDGYFKGQDRLRAQIRAALQLDEENI